MLSASRTILTAQWCMRCERNIGVQRWCTFTDMPVQLWIVPGGSLSYMPIRTISAPQYVERMVFTLSVKLQQRQWWL